MLYNVAYCSNYSPVNYHHQQQVCRLTKALKTFFVTIATTSKILRYRVIIKTDKTLLVLMEVFIFQ